MAYQPTPLSVTSTANSTTTGLAISGVFTGTLETVTQYASATISVFANQVSATDGLSIQQSSDGTNWDIVDSYTIPITAAGGGKTFAVQITGQSLRVVYTNGATASTVFRLQTIYHYIAPPTSSVRPQDARTNDNDMQESIAYLSAYNGTTWDRLRSTGTGVLSTSTILTAGAASIGSVTSITAGVVPGTAATNLGKAEDAAHTSGDVGVMTLAVRNDNAATASTSANNDYSQVSVDINGTQFTRDAPSNTATKSTVAAAATSTTILAANAARRTAVIVNESTIDCYLSYGGTASITSYTFVIPAGQTTFIKGDEYAGALVGIWASATGNARVTEVTI